MTLGLRTDSLCVRYGNVTAVDGMCLSVAPGQIVALLGANGAGKSSAVRALSGTVPSSGQVLVGDVDISGASAEQRARLIAHVPEGRRLFAEQTVDENLMLGAYSASRAERRDRLAEVLTTLPKLQPLRRRRAGKLSGGEQQMVALGRGLMSRAPVLAIDELSLGLAPVVASSFADALEALRERGLAILLIEQYLPLALRIADHIVVLERGKVMLQGPCAQVREDVMALQAAYLGEHAPPTNATTSGPQPFA